MQAIILAGGFGTRLRSVIQNIPKPMADVAGRPFLCWLMDNMQNQGITEAVLCVHHQHELIRNYFGVRYGHIAIHYLVEEKPLGTGGAIKAALEYLKPDKPVYILNGDSLVELDYRVMRSIHHRKERRITLATRRVSDCSRYSELTIKKGNVERFDVLGAPAPGDISAGFYIAAPELFAGYDVPRAFSFERDFLAKYAPQLLPAAYPRVDYFIDIGVPEDYARAQAEIPMRSSEPYLQFAEDQREIYLPD